MDEGYPDQDIYEVEDLIEYKHVEGKDFYLVKWKGYGETSWEPDENIGQELSELKESAKRGATGDRKRKHEKTEKADKAEKKEKKEKKDKKRRRRESSEEKKKKKDSDSESSKEEEKMQGMPGMMPSMPSMMPSMPTGMPTGMPMMPGMMPGFAPDMPMMPGMMPGMMMPGDGKGMGKGMPPMMMKGKGGGKPMPGWPFEPMGKGMPPGPMGKGMPMKGKKGFPGPGYWPFPEMGMMNREALDTQRFAVERKRRLREFVGALHAHLARDTAGVSDDKVQKTKDFHELMGLQLEGHQLPVTAPTEMVVADALWLIWVFDPKERSEDRELLMNFARLVRVNNARARQLLIRSVRDVWPKPTSMPSGGSIQLFSSLAPSLPRPAEMGTNDAGSVPGAGTGTGMGGALQPGSPEYWRELITQIYAEHNPSKLSDVDTLLAKYRGRERTLYLGICDKYKVPPTFEMRMMGGMGPGGIPQMAPPGGMPPGGMPPPPGSMPPGMMMGPPGWQGPAGGTMPGMGGMPAGQNQSEEEYVQKMRKLICDVYREHNPSKLDGVDNLLQKYKGREELVYRGICDKYNVEPKLPKKNDDGEAAKTILVEKFKELITEIYAEHNKEKVNEVDDILKKYKGKEKSLYLAVCHKYNIEPKIPGLKVKKSEKKSGATNAETEKAQSEKLAQIKPLICEVYQAHNPAKLEFVDELLAKYKGNEESLYNGICAKYGVEPKLPKPAAGAAQDGSDVTAGGSTGPAEAPSISPAAAAGTVALLPGNAGASGGVGSGMAALRQAYSDLIREVYREHNPLKLDSVDSLLEKYAGQEQDLYLSICRKYSVRPKDPEGFGDMEWINAAGEHLSRLIEGLISVLVLHGSGLRADDAKRLAAWEEVKPRVPSCTMRHCFELGGLTPPQVEQLVRGLKGDDGTRWRKLQERCDGVDVRAPVPTGDGGGSARALTLVHEGTTTKGRLPFDKAVAHLTDSISRAVRDCMESDDEATKYEKWFLPWSSEEVAFVTHIVADDGGSDQRMTERKEVGVEYRRGCWTPRRHAPLHSNSSHHNLCGPDVEARLPHIWRALADKLWLGILALMWGEHLPMEAVVVVESTGGRKAQEPTSGSSGCSAAKPSASVIITAATEDELDQAKSAITPVLSRVLSELHVNAVFVPASLTVPQQRHAGRGLLGPGAGPGVLLSRDDAMSSSSSSSSEDEAASEEIMSDAEPSVSYRPLRLSRSKVRDAYLQGLLCLNCDAADHKHQQCPFQKKVCWNCHGNHAGNECPMRCRFCRDRHDFPLLECVKRVCRRVNDWKKSKQAQEQRGVLSSFEQLMIKLEGFEDFSLAKHNQEVQQLVKSLAEQHALFPGDLHGLAMSILNMQPPNRQPQEPATPPPPPGPPPKPYVAPKLPKEPPPAMPENKYPWSEKIFLDTLLARGMYGANILSRIIGRGGSHHRKMESESGARVFFRGLGVSGRDLDLTDPVDCRLHISVKGDVPQQGQSVRRIIKEIVTELDNEIAERGESGPQLDRPRDADLHPFGFLLAKGAGPDIDEALKFRFPEEDGQALNDILVWLKQAKLPLELDSDTQWRTTLQVTPVEPPPPDDAPSEAEKVGGAFNKLIAEWHYPSPYWFEEHDLCPTGLWTSLTVEDVGEGAGPIALQQGQGVRLSTLAIDHFATILERAELEDVDRETIIDVLIRLRGVVRRQAEDEQLLLYLAYPWAWFAESMGRGLKLPFSREQVHGMLVQLGRVGGRPTEARASPPFRGFTVEWMPLKPGTMPPDTERRPIIPRPAPRPPITTPELRPPEIATTPTTPMPASTPSMYAPVASQAPRPVPPQTPSQWNSALPETVPTPPQPASLPPGWQPDMPPPAVPLQPPHTLLQGAPVPPAPVPVPAPCPVSAPAPVQPAATAPPVPSALPQAPPKGFCKYWLPDAVFATKQDLKELIAGSGGSHFAHVLKKYPSVDLRIEGQCSVAAPPAHRLHVSMSSEDSDVFETAAADVLDLVETVCDMVGEELGLGEDAVDGLIREIRAEKYFEAHGIRTPLPPVRRQEAGDAPPSENLGTASQSFGANVPAASSGQGWQVPAATMQDVAKETDFEFIDEDIDLEPAGGVAGDDTDDDARTEGSDALSDITDDEGGDGAKGRLEPMAFDDI